MQHIYAILFHSIYPDFLHFLVLTNQQFYLKLTIRHIHATHRSLQNKHCIC